MIEASPVSRLNSSKMSKLYIPSTLNIDLIHTVAQTIELKFILLCVWAEAAVLGSTRTALKFKYEI